MSGEKAENVAGVDAKELPANQRLYKMLECALCHKTLKQPKMLRCYHFFCANCLNVSRQKHVGNSNSSSSASYTCHVCRLSTREAEVTDVPIVEDLLDALEQSKEEKLTCQMCKSDEPRYRCADCKMLYCKTCKANHDIIPMCSRHRCCQLNGDSQEIVVDKLVFCRDHPDEIAKINCMQCNAIICVLCNAVNHNDHKVETITDAVHRLEPIIDANRKTMEKHIENCAATISVLERKSRDIMDHEAKLKEQAKLQLVQVKEQAEHDCTQLLQEIGAATAKDMTKISKNIQILTTKMDSMKNAIVWTDTMMRTAHSTSLLLELQSGPSRRLLDMERKIDYPELTRETQFSSDKLVLKSTQSRFSCESYIGLSLDVDRRIEVEDGATSGSASSPSRHRKPVRAVQSSTRTVSFLGDRNHSSNSNEATTTVNSTKDAPGALLKSGRVLFGIKRFEVIGRLELRDDLRVEWISDEARVRITKVKITSIDQMSTPLYEGYKVKRVIDGSKKFEVSLPPFRFVKYTAFSFSFFPKNHKISSAESELCLDIESWEVGNNTVITELCDRYGQLVSSETQKAVYKE